MDNPLYFLGHEIQETDPPCRHPYRPIRFLNSETGSMLEFRVGDEKFPNSLMKVLKGGQPPEGRVIPKGFSLPDQVSSIQAHGELINLEVGIWQDYPELGRALANFQFLKMPFDFLGGGVGLAGPTSLSKAHLDGKVEEAGFGVVGQLYKSEEDYDEQTLKQRVEMILRRGIPEGVPTEDLREAARLLRLKV